MAFDNLEVDEDDEEKKAKSGLAIGISLVGVILLVRRLKVRR